MPVATPQSGVLPHATQHALYLSASIQADADIDALRAAVADVPTLTDKLAALDPAAQLVSVVAVGSEAWSRLYPDSRPAGLQGFPQFADSVIPLPHTPVDLFIHLRSERHDLNFDLARHIAKRLGTAVRWQEHVHGFRYHDKRDLTGFVDGTENPQGEERATVALVDDGSEFDGGSHIHVQRYVHDMSRWEQCTPHQQEDVIGRTKLDDVEMDDAVKPDTAHIARVVIEDHGEELAILRHSMPYGNLDEMGLYFVAYGASPDNFTRMLAAMFRPDHIGHYDHLLNYTRPVTGAAFFAPSRYWLEQWRD